MKEKTPLNPHDCPIYNFCSENLCPFDIEVESKPGTKKDLCLHFEKIKEHLSAEQIKRYESVVNKL